MVWIYYDSASEFRANIASIISTLIESFELNITDRFRNINIVTSVKIKNTEIRAQIIEKIVGRYCLKRLYTINNIINVPIYATEKNL